MSKLRSLYVETIGLNHDQIENSLWYLSELSLEGAIEIDNHLLGNNDDFSHVKELTKILEKYQLNDDDSFLTKYDFPYLPIWRAFKKNSDKNIQFIPELALEMRLFRSDLEIIPSDYKRLEDFRTLLCDLSKEFFNDRYQHNYINFLTE